ncbi:ABC transporter permease [Paenibacillus tianjinensis]|uniref:ABC transporter permease n=1 Tax=Paenibacillus tianjinensis TaxID=2810347 RepID=A0ABX7LD46_9BACL|nr:ABC transporter permease [Paenibacillus tianjinensis]QSF46043.1 ABC transporter permease [Paenibacillus tianjinensis]
MKLAASVSKSFKENLRDWKILTMVLLFSPFFLVLMNLFYGGTPAAYHLGILNLDSGRASIELIHSLKMMEGQDNSRIFKISGFDNEDQLKAQVKEKAMDIGIVIPEDYSGKLAGKATGNNLAPAQVSFYGSMGNMRYSVAAVFAADGVYKQGMDIAKITLPANINETFLEKKQSLNEFEGYVPGLISLAVLMVLFTASASIVKENDKRTLIRLKLSRLGAFNFLGGICITQATIAAGAIILSYGTALGLGYRPAPDGGLGAFLVIGILSSLSMVAISLVVASFLNTMFDVLTIGCFPFFILMFFSGSMFPLPKLNVVTVRGHSFGITDLLPLTHTANAFNNILNYGAGLSEVWFDFIMIAILTVIYFGLGLILYQKRKLSRA